MTKVIIAGTRLGCLPEQLFAAIQNSGFKIDQIVAGEAPGVDTQAKEYAFMRGIPYLGFYADWAKYGKAAGIYRNRQMGNYADALIALPGMKSRGTLDMINYMKQLNKPTYVYPV